MKKIFFILFITACGKAFSQDSLPVKAPLSARTIKARSWLAASASVVGYGGSLIVLSNDWYKKYPQAPFHFFNDNGDWLQVDKAGHTYGAYSAGRLSMEAWRWAGVSKKQRIWIGGLSGAGFMTVIEILDGFSSEWGFSLGDLGANLLGSGALISQELAWNEQRVQLKFSFHTRSYGDPVLDQRATDLFGRRTSQKIFKDYNNQTYWASANIRSFFKQSRIPSWLNIAVGYGAEGMFGGSVNLLKDANGNILFDRRDITRYRQWYIAPDIDLTRIKTKSKVLKATFFLLNSFKFPTPSIGFSRKGVEWKWLHF